MSNSGRPAAKHALATAVWQLWIDAVGGFRILEGKSFTVGGCSDEELADIAVRSSWGRRVAALIRGDDELWLQQPVVGSEPEPLPKSTPVVFGERLRIGNSQASWGGNDPAIILSKPSPLSGTVVVTIQPPHRFVAACDAILLFEQTLLIGAAAGNHIRVPQMAATGLIMTKRDDQWTAQKNNGSKQTIHEGERIEMDHLVMTLRRDAKI